MNAKHEGALRWLGVAALGFVLAGAACAQAAPGTAYSAGKAIEFHPGNPKARAMLARIADLRDLVAEDFSVAMLDLNDDGRAEIIVQSRSSAFCGSGGCMTMVVEQQGQRMVTLLTQNLGDGLGTTQEKVGGYRALAGLDEKGVIAIADKKGTPLHGRQMVYPMAVAAVAEPAAPAGGRVASIVGIRLGMPAAEAEALLRQHAATYGGEVMRVNKFALKARCPGCKAAFDYHLEASMPLANRAAGNVALDGVVVNLSPPLDEGSRVISVARRVTLKQPVARDSLVGQIVERLGPPQRTDGLRAAWYLGGGRFPVRYPAGSGDDWQCSIDPDDRTSLLQQVISDEAYRRTGMSVPLHNDCGAVLTLLAGGGPKPDMVLSISTVMLDHRAFGQAAVATRAFLDGQQQASDQRTREEVRNRPAPKLN